MTDPRSRINEKDYRDYDFISSELKRFLEKPKEEQIQDFMNHPFLAMNGLKTPQGGTLLLSAEGQQRFAQIARRGLKELGIEAARRHRLELVTSKVKEEFTARILAGHEVTGETAHNIFTAAVDRLTTTYEELSYYVPCSVVSQTVCERFSIGPATFVLRDRFLKQNEAAIREAARTADGAVIQPLLDRTKDFYGTFQWIACITVPPCDAEISRSRAHAGVQKGLDIFKLIVGSERAPHVKQAYDLTIPHRHAELVSSASGQFSITAGGKMHDAVLNDNWYDQVSHMPLWQLMQSVVLHWWNTWADLNEIETRFLDALAWHSDAISEPDLGARIVKFWTAIERVLSWPPGSNIGARAAVLCSETRQEFARKAHTFSNLYQKRSDVIHGSANRTNEAWYVQAALESEQTSKDVLFQYVYNVNGIQRMDMLNDRKKLENWLKGLDHLAKHYRQQLKVSGA